MISQQFWVNQVGTLFRDGGEGAAVYDLHQTFAFLHVPVSVEKNSVLDCRCENGYWNSFMQDSCRTTENDWQLPKIAQSSVYF